MPRNMKIEVLEDRVYRSNAPRNGKPAGVYYLIKAIFPGNLATVSSYNPGNPSRKLITRTLRLESLAGYALELVPYENEPEALRSKQGALVAMNVAAKSAAPKVDLRSLRESAEDFAINTLAPFCANRYQMSVREAAAVLSKTMDFASALSKALEAQS